MDPKHNNDSARLSLGHLAIDISSTSLKTDKYDR